MEQQSALCGCLSVRCPISRKILENLSLLKFFFSKRTFARSVKRSAKYATTELKVITRKEQFCWSVQKLARSENNYVISLK